MLTSLPLRAAPFMLAAAACLPSARAAVVVFSNPEVFDPARDAGLTAYLDPGAPPQFFSRWDPTLPVTQQAAADPLRSFTRTAGSPPLQGLTAEGLASGASLQFVCETAPLSVFDFSLGRNVEFPPLPVSFGPGAAGGMTVGPGQNFQSNATVAIVAHFGQTSNQAPAWLGPPQDPPTTAPSATMGFRIELADGTHYGFITWMRVVHFPALSRFAYQPLRWGYETEPNTPITVPGPTGSMLALATAIACTRRRRGT